MLQDDRKGYAVMTKDLTGISFEDVNLETCKKYLYPDSVIVERIPVVRGFSIRILFLNSMYHLISSHNFLWLYFWFNKEYIHKCGKIVYPEQTQGT
jgi:hypothetical protein